MAAKTGKERREYHASSNAKTSQSHLRTHCQRHVVALEPLDDSSADGNACHLYATAEYHKAAGGELG